MSSVIAPRTAGARRRNAIPSATARSVTARRSAAATRGRPESTAALPAERAAASPNAGAAPCASISRPATIGPRFQPTLRTVAVTATALAKRSRGTRFGSRVESAGISKAPLAEARQARASMAGRLLEPNSARPRQASAAPSWASCAMRTRSRASASAPASSPAGMAGRNSTRPSRPRAAFEPESA